MFVIKTERLYYIDSYIREFSAVVTDCFAVGGAYGIILDKTAFYPEGGGQPSDAGEIDGVSVVSVRERDGVVIHNAGAPIEKGASVSCKINWRERFRLMQEHTGEHIVSGLIKKMYGYNNVGFHMGSESVTIDIDGAFTQDDAAKIEDAANEAVYANVPVFSTLIEPGEPADAGLRSKKDFDDPMRVVTIGGYDACACCGTHVRATGEIGVIKITEIHKYKNGTRLYMLCGRRAAEDYAWKNSRVHEISEMLSAKPSEAGVAVRQLLEQNAALKRQLADARLERLSRIADAVPPCSGAVCVLERGLSADELRGLCAALSEKAVLAAAFSRHGDAVKYALGSRQLDVRPLSAELAGRFSGKGGGNANAAGGSVSCAESEIYDFLLGAGPQPIRFVGEWNAL